MKILIVDDEQDILDSLQEFFEEEGFTVCTAADGTEALASLGADPLPGLVILDLILPTMSGNAVYATMQRDPRLSGVPVIISSSDPSRAPGGVTFLKKPLDLNNLLDTVRRVGTAS